MRRPRKQVPKVELFRSFVGKDKEFFDTLDIDNPDDTTHVTSRSVTTINVSVPNRVSDNPREMGNEYRPWPNATPESGDVSGL